MCYGVLLAFADDNGTAQARLEGDTEMVLKNLQNELIGNRSMVLEWMAYYDSMQFHLAHQMTAINKQPVRADADWLGTIQPKPSVSYLPQETAWQMAQSTQVLRNFQYNTTYNLTHCYRYQTDIEQTRKMVFEILYQNQEPNAGLHRLKALKALYQELTQKQAYLLGAYRDALIALDQELTSRID